MEQEQRNWRLTSGERREGLRKRVWSVLSKANKKLHKGRNCNVFIWKLRGFQLKAIYWASVMYFLSHPHQSPVLWPPFLYFVDKKRKFLGSSDTHTNKMTRNKQLVWRWHYRKAYHFICQQLKVWQKIGRYVTGFRTWVWRLALAQCGQMGSNPLCSDLLGI